MEIRGEGRWEGREREGERERERRHAALGKYTQGE